MTDTERRLAAALAEWWASQCDDLEDAEFVRNAPETAEAGREYAAALLPVVAEIEAEARAGVLRLVREVETEMSAQAADAWRSADARRGLSDHEALLVHADALTRWSERFRMAFDGYDYRTEARTAEEPHSGADPIIRHDTPDEGGQLDEFIARGCDMHLEAMGEAQWWIGVTTADGREWLINVGATSPRAKGYARVEEDV